MRVLRIVTLLAMLGVVAAPAAAAAAPPYPPGPPVVVVNKTTIITGNTVIVTGDFFQALENISIDVTYISLAAHTVESTAESQATAPRDTGVMVPASLPRIIVKTVRADGVGHFETTVELDRAGLVVITATGLSSGRVGSVTVRVLPRSAPPLPVTGSDGSRLFGEIGAGAGAVLLGGVLVALTMVRRRRLRDAATVGDGTAS